MESSKTPLEEDFFCNTLSPILFLLLFNPIIKFPLLIHSSGYRQSLKPLNVKGLPPFGTHLYVGWEEVDSSGPVGWYFCAA